MRVAPWKTTVGIDTTLMAESAEEFQSFITEVGRVCEKKKVWMKVERGVAPQTEIEMTGENIEIEISYKH